MYDKLKGCNQARIVFNIDPSPGNSLPLEEMLKVLVYLCNDFQGDNTNDIKLRYTFYICKEKVGILKAAFVFY